MVDVKTPICCSHEKFRTSPATYKVAASWSGGDFSELKTFGFANDECIEDVVRSALERVARFRPSEGESLGELHIYRLNPKKRDYELERAADIEQQLSQAGLRLNFPKNAVC